MRLQYQSVIVLTACFLAGLWHASSALAAKANCDEIWFKEKTHTHEVNPADLRQCLVRGWDPPKEWREDEGKSPGIKVGGSGGFSYGAVTAPESTPRARNANASVTKDVIKSTCLFPPRIKMSSGGISLPKGPCYDFFNDLLKDVNGDTYSSPAPDSGVSPDDPCPAESDTTGIYGIKQSIAAGGSFTASCGGMIPTFNAQLTLNRGANYVAMTRNGTRSIAIYKKSGSSYTSVASAALPKYLCQPELRYDDMFYEKSVDLTPPISQVIAFDASVGAIAVRLQSRAHMDPNYIPPYNPDDPEKYLIIPIDSSGVPNIPVDCSLETVYFMEPHGIRQDIVVEPSYILDAECNTFGIDETQYNDGEPKCPPGATMGHDKKCYDDITGIQVPSIPVDDWKGKCPCSASVGCTKCPDGSVPKKDQCPAPSSGVCPQNSGIPSTAQKCPDGSTPVAGKCPNICSGNPAMAYCKDLGGFVLEPPACGSAAFLCDVATIIPPDAPLSCVGKSQYAVLNRPNLYYPPETSAKIYPVSGQSFGIADTVDNNIFFASGQTVLYLQKTAPSLKLNEGGFITLKDASIIIMSPYAIVEASSGRLTLAGGGERVSSGGTQLQSFAEGAVYTIPASLRSDTLKVKLGRNLTFPSGFTLPTSSNPYIRLPIDKPPE